MTEEDDHEKVRIFEKLAFDSHSELLSISRRLDDKIHNMIVFLGSLIAVLLGLSYFILENQFYGTIREPFIQIFLTTIIISAGFFVFALRTLVSAYRAKKVPIFNVANLINEASNEDSYEVRINVPYTISQEDLRWSKRIKQTGTDLNKAINRTKYGIYLMMLSIVLIFVSPCFR